MNADWVRELEGEVETVSANNPLLLDDPWHIRVIRSGEVAVFVVRLDSEEVSGIRHFLFDCLPGGLLCGTDPGEESQYAFLAVPLQETEFLKMPAAEFEELAARQTGQVMRSVETWIQALVKAAGREDRTAVQFKSGDDGLLDSLRSLQNGFLRSFSLIEMEKAREAADRLHRKMRLQRQIMRDAAGRLANVADPKAVTRKTVEGTPLMAAARAVLEAEGIAGRSNGQSFSTDNVRELRQHLDYVGPIRSRLVRLSDDWWKSCSQALLAFKQDGNRPVALIPHSPTRYTLFDPTAKSRMPVTSAVASSLSPTAYTFYRPLAAEIAGPLDILRFGLRRHTRDIARLFTVGVLVTLVGMITPIATGILIDTAIPDANRNLLFQLGLGLLAAAVGGALFELSRGYIMVRLATASTADTQTAVWNRVLDLRPSFLRKFSSGDLSSRALAISAIYKRLGITSIRTLFSSFIALLNLALMIYYSATLALIAVVVGIIVGGVTILAGRRTIRCLRPLYELEGKIFGLSVQLINGISKLRTAGAESSAFAYWSERYSEQQKLNLKIQSVQDRLSVFNQVVPILTSALIFMVAAHVMLQPLGEAISGITVGSFLAFNIAFGTFLGGMTSLSNIVIEILETLNLWERAAPILEAEPEMATNQAEPGTLSGRITADHLTFRYRDSGPLILEDVTFHAVPGEFIALVGPSGSGKSTIFRLLLGFETPESGSIYYDGQDLEGLHPVALRRQLGVVMQNSTVISASIFHNIAAGALITMDHAWAAARAAGFACDIEAMPMGMHTLVSEGGTNLSGGQKQRLLIARALVGQPSILLFDEATSSLDNQTQAVVSESLEKLQVTRIVIAHRLSTIKNADRIYVLDAGRIVQQGTFDELSKQPGLFSRIMTRQMI